MEAPFDKLEGVVSVTSGYTGGQNKNPAYENLENLGIVESRFHPGRSTLHEGEG